MPAFMMDDIDSSPFLPSTTNKTHGLLLDESAEDDLELWSNDETFSRTPTKGDDEVQKERDLVVAVGNGEVDSVGEAGDAAAGQEHAEENGVQEEAGSSTREARLVAERDTLAQMNGQLERVISQLSRAFQASGNLTSTIQNTHDLMDVYVKLMSQTEHTTRILDEDGWSLKRDEEEEERQRLEEERKQREAEERRRKEEEEIERKRQQLEQQELDKKKMADKSKKTVPGSRIGGIRGRTVRGSARGR